MVVNAGKAAVVESKCSLGELASLCPQKRTLHWSDGNEEVSIAPPSNCALQPQASANQWWKRGPPSSITALKIKE